jgi:hypothetical protein
MDQPPVKIGQYILGKNLGIGAFGKVRLSVCDFLTRVVVKASMGSKVFLQGKLSALFLPIKSTFSDLTLI